MKKGKRPIRVLWPRQPVLLGEKIAHIVFAKNQPQYLPLPALRSKAGVVTTRWRMSWRDRLLALWTGNVYVQASTFNHPLQPLRVMIVAPRKEDVL